MDTLLPCLFLISQFQLILSASLPSLGRHLCPRDQSLALLKLKQSFVIDDSASTSCDTGSQVSYPKIRSWNSSTDCCSWDGVTCDDFTGKIIGLDLSCSQIQGIIDSSSSLFQFSHLRKLNLAYNNFSSSNISYGFVGFRSLTHLNLSSTDFSGQIPAEMLHLSQLTSLDLSQNLGSITIQPYVFEMLLQHLPQLTELFLSGTNIASTVPRNISFSLTSLSLEGSGLLGELPSNIFHLPNLQRLVLRGNSDLTGQLPKVKWNCSTSLIELDLSSTSFSGELPDSIGHLKSLNILDLSESYFSGSIPLSLNNLTQITDLILSSNNFSGHLLNFSSLTELITLDLENNQLEGQMSDAFDNLNKLKYLYLAFNNLTGNFPSSVTKLEQLEILDFSDNSLTGAIPSSITGFQNLNTLFLADNLFNGTIPSWLFSLPSLSNLDLRSNQLTGQIDDFLCESIKYIDLSDNKLEGPIPKSLAKLVNLTSLILSSNNFSGDVEVGLFSNLNQLQSLRLSNNGLSLIPDNIAKTTLPASLNSLWLSSCNIKEIDFLRTAQNLGKLDLSNNQLHGRIPSWAGSNWRSLLYLNLSYNFLAGVDQLHFDCISSLDLRSNLLRGPVLIPPITASAFFISNNFLTGGIPPSICNLTDLQILDLSTNSLSGVIPQCLGNFSPGLSVLDLHMNFFHGLIPTNFTLGNQLRSLNLRGNQLEGNVPRSLANCLQLEVLDLGSNSLKGTFPMWLGKLPNLTVLSLRSNKFIGQLSTSGIGPSFSQLRIIDISYNQFTGVLPARFFENLRAMKKADELSTIQTYLGGGYYQDTVVLVMKGQEIELVRILSIFTSIDLSGNKFEGQIPDLIGNLISLRLLNFSHNSFGGQIPPAFGNLSVVESLDLSWNQLYGRIPQQLTALTFLSVLNLSQNHLVGRIPRGNQFDTFQNDSYIGNSGLCGYPLSIGCGNDAAPEQPLPPSVFHEGIGYETEFFSGFTWRAVVIGYGCGMVIGILMGCFVFLTGNPKWFIRIVQEEEHKMVKKKQKRKDVKWL